MVGVAWSGSNSDYESFMRRHSLTFTNLDDTDGNVFQKYEIPFQPAWVFVSKDGTTTTKLGAISDAELENVLLGL
jgi:peroxiredoxin